MRLVRNLFAWVLVGVFTVFLAVGVEIVSHKSFSHGAATTSALSATTSTPSAATSSGANAPTSSAALVSTTPVTITRTYHGDDSYSPSTTVTGSGATVSTTSVTYRDN